MKRDNATKKLARMLETIESGQIPVNVQEFYVFGSYVRGALDPGDLDVLVFYDGGEALNARIEAETNGNGCSWEGFIGKRSRRFNSAIRQSLRRPGERIDVGICPHDPSGSNRFGNARIDQEKVLLWSQSDRDWRSKLDALKPDPAAGQFERGHFFNIKRLNASLTEMQAVVKAIRDRELMLTKIPIEEIQLKVSPWHQHWMDHWFSGKCFGKETRKVVPYALWWLERCRQRYDPNKSFLHSIESTAIRTNSHLVLMGSPSLNRMRWSLESRTTKRVCLIPHFKKNGPNELLIFEHGPKWVFEGEKKSKRTRRQDTDAA